MNISRGHSPFGGAWRDWSFGHTTSYRIWHLSSFDWVPSQWVRTHTDDSGLNYEWYWAFGGVGILWGCFN